MLKSFEKRSFSVLTSAFANYDRMRWPFGVAAVYLAIVYLVQPVFFTKGNLSALLYYACLLAPAVLGVHFLIVLGLFDLSIGAVAAASGIITAKCLAGGSGETCSVLLGLATGVFFGVMNWIFVSKIRIPALIATLVTLGAARAVSLAVGEGEIIGGLPDRFGLIAQGGVGSFRYVVVFSLILVTLSEVGSRYHVVFTRMYLVGSNRIATANSGISVSRVEFVSFLLAGVGAALVGIFQCSRTLSASPMVFQDLALESIAACVIGGTGLTGGTGRPIGAFLGMLLVVVSRNLAVLAGVSLYWKDLAVSAVLLASVLLSRIEKK